MELIFILIVGFVLRFLFFLSEASDEYSHLWMIKRIKRINNLWKDNVENSIIKGYRGYPPLPHYIVSRFPEKYWVVIGKLLNIIYDLITIIIVYYFSVFLFRDLWQIKLQGVINAPTAVAFLYATSPILSPVTARLKAIGGRTMGNLLCLIYIILFAYGFLSGNYFVYFFCFPIGWAIIISSQFGLQYIVFCCFFLSIFYLNPVPMMLISVIIISGIFVPKLGIKKLLQRKINHFIWYIKNYTKGTTASNRNNIKDMLLFPVYLVKNPKYFVSLCFKGITLIIGAYSIPPVVILVFWIVISPESMFLFINHDVTLFLFFVSISTVFIFILTSLKP
ncbi:MAG: hypothetical protein KKF54_02300, partial [Candidatus Omnitrophica bacterium]|nr:hypothetical protein [Candidatus Omnitrophota bacterium]